ncbi:unnamed protein product [Boreogadus saida]
MGLNHVRIPHCSHFLQDDLEGVSRYHTLRCHTLRGHSDRCPTPKDQLTAKLTDRAHQCMMQQEAVMNNIALLAHDISTMAADPHRLAERAVDMAKTACAILCLCSTGAVAAARTAAWQHLIQRNLWLQQTLGILEPMRRQLPECPISPDGLFGHRLSSMVAEMQAASEEAEKFRRHVSRPPPPPWQQRSAPGSRRHHRPRQPLSRRHRQLLLLAPRLTSPAHLHRRLRRAASECPGQRAHGSMSRPTSADEGNYGAREKRERKLHFCHKLSRQGMPLLMTNTPSPFGQSSPWAARRTPPLAAAAGAQAWLVSMTAASKQEAAQLLSEHYSEWLNACTLAKWMDRLISKGHALQFTSVPPRFNGIVETTLSSKDQQLSLLAELQQLLAKKLDSAVMRARLSQQRMETLWSLLRRCSPGSVVSALSVMRLLGMMSAAHTVVPLGLLHMRQLQRWFSRLRIDPVRKRRRKVTIPLSVGPDLTHGGDPRTHLSVHRYFSVGLGRNM